MRDIQQVFEMGYAEYLFRMEMATKQRHLELENKLYDIWLSERMATAQKKDGKYVFKSFEEFKKIINHTTQSTSKRRNYDELRRLAIVERQFERGGS